MALDKSILDEFAWLEEAQTDPSIDEDCWRARGNALLEKAGALTSQDLDEFMKHFAHLQEVEYDREKTQLLHRQLKGERKLIKEDAISETWRTGEFTITVPKLTPNLGLELYAAASRRREADLSGQCACGARGKVEQGTYIIEHDLSCPATDDNLRRLYQRLNG